MNAANHLKSDRGLGTRRIFRSALFGAGLSLLFYLPYRYATNPPEMPGLYAFLLPLSSILAIGGMALAFNPGLSVRQTTFVRAGVAAFAVLWLAAGMACIPALALKITSAPAAGLLASFQMLAQHVFLSASVAAFALKPVETLVWCNPASPATGENRAMAVDAQA